MYSVEYENAFYRIECFLVFSIEWISYSIPEVREVMRKNFWGLSPTKEVIAEMSTHLLE
jgi:hypothetical protein